MSLRELKRAARNDLKGKWHIGIIVTIVAFIIGVYSFGLLPMINLPAEEWLKDPSVLLKDWRNIFYFDMRSVRMGLFYLLGAAGTVLLLFAYGKSGAMQDKGYFSLLSPDGAGNRPQAAEVGLHFSWAQPACCARRISVLRICACAVDNG